MMTTAGHLFAPSNSLLLNAFQTAGAKRFSYYQSSSSSGSSFGYSSRLLIPVCVQNDSFILNMKHPASAIMASSRSQTSSSQSSMNLSYVEINGCLVYPPSKGKRPKAILQFLGGAFIGAAPELTYRLFIELLAKDGFLVLAVPYNITFNHAAAAEEINQKFNRCLDLMLEDDDRSARVISAASLSELPIISVGHSNGALMQMLIGSTCKYGRLPKANVVISFNNKPASEAVPFFDQTGATFSQISAALEASPLDVFARNSTADGRRIFLEDLLPLPPGTSKENFESVRKFLEQIPGLINEVTQGVSEFQPVPIENQTMIMNSYCVPHNLLVKFTVDTVDETDSLEKVMQTCIKKIGGSVTRLMLTGTHATPLALDIKWKAGDVYTPADAIGQLLRSASIADLTRLVRSISDWFEKINSLL